MKRTFIFTCVVLFLQTTAVAQGVRQLWNTYFEGIVSVDSNGNNPVDRVRFDTVQRSDGQYDFVFFKGKFYGVNQWGFIYEYDPFTSTHTNLHQLHAVPVGGFDWSTLTLRNNVFHVLTGMGRDYPPEEPVFSVGSAYTFDPVSKALDFDYYFSPERGISPCSYLTEKNGVLFGMTISNIFGWNPATNTFAVKHQFDYEQGLATGSLTLKDGKFYGVTCGDRSIVFGDIAEDPPHGILFEYNPYNHDFIVKYDFAMEADGIHPVGTLALKDNKFYGMTHRGGTHGLGVIFEWDPATNIYTKKIDFDGTNGGSPFQSSLMLFDGKFYGATGDTEGEPENWGTFFQWDPANNTLIKKGSRFALKNFIAVPAPIANFATGSCILFPSVTIDNGNNHKWVPITDSKGDVLAEIKANGNNLGVLTVQAYKHEGSIRTDAQGHPYLNRNITITPEQQPSEGNPVDIRLYVPRSEFEALLNEPGAAIDDITDLAIFKGNDACEPSVQMAEPVSVSAEDYDYGYVLKASIASFSSFYFASNTFVVLPFSLISFEGAIKNYDAVLQWRTENEQNTLGFDVERSTDRIHYTTIGTVSSKNTIGIHTYEFTDAAINSLSVPTVYYRIKMKDRDGRSTYSSTIALQLDITTTSVQFYPNPASNRSNLVITTDKTQQVQWKIIDNTGKVIRRNTLHINKGVISLPVDVMQLSRGVYYLDVKGNNFIKLIRFVKQ